MTQALVAVLVALVLVGAGLKGMNWARRQLLLRSIDPKTVIRERRGVSMRVLVQGTRVLPGMSRKNANRTVGDLVLTPDRFLLTSGKGAIADLRTERGRKFKSVRCTGPGRLVIEGEVPGSRPDMTGMYRVEVNLEDAKDWAEALKPWSENADFSTFDAGRADG